MPPVQLVLVSDDPRKCFDTPTLKALSPRWDPIFVTGFHGGRTLYSQDIANVMALNWWQAFNAGGVCITMTPAQLHADPCVSDSPRALWRGVLVETLETRLFFMGVTGCSPVLRTIRRRLGPIDVALLPIGSERRKTVVKADHVTALRAVKAHRDLAPRYSIAIPTLAPIRDDEERRVRAELDAALVNDAISADRFVMLCPGGSIVVETIRAIRAT